MYKKKSIKAERFVTVWQTSSSVDEVCERTGMNKKSASVRACLYRKKGVNLKHMKRRSKGRPALNIELLNQLATAATEEVVDEHVDPAVYKWPKLPVC